MIVWVIGFNLLVSLGCLVAAWYLWQLRQALANAATAAAIWQGEAQGFLAISQLTEAILTGRQLTASTHDSYRQLQLQLQRLQQLLRLLVFLTYVWRNSGQILSRRRWLSRPWRIRS